MIGINMQYYVRTLNLFVTINLVLVSTDFNKNACMGSGKRKLPAGIQNYDTIIEMENSYE